MFLGDSLGAFGKEVLQICKEENVLLDCTVQDTELMAIIMKDLGGRALFRMHADKAVQFMDWIKKRTDKKRHLLVIECSPGCRMEDLFAIMDSFDCERIHLSFNSWNGSGLNEENLAGPFSLLQSLYDIRVSNAGKEKAYKEMVAVLGGNLKQFLQ